MKFLARLSVICFLFAPLSIKAQTDFNATMDTVRLDVGAVEQRFIEKNLSILAAKYDVEISKTNVLQAQLWYNPNLTYSQTLYNNATHKLFDVSNSQNGTSNGEVSLQLQQLITYAGRHTNLVKLNKIDAERSTYVFSEVVRSLKLELYNDLATVYGDQQKAILYRNQIKALNTLIVSTLEQVKLGVSSRNDLIRLQAELQDDKNQLLSTQSDLQDAETDIKVLLHYTPNTYIVINKDLPKVNSDAPSLATALNTANQNRGDMKLADKTVDYQAMNLKLQHSLSVPDLYAGLTYDRAGGAGYNYNGISLSSDIPVFNRNQGQIAAAKLELSKAQLMDSIQLNTVQNQVAGAYAKMLKYKQQYDLIDASYVSDLEALVANAIKNYNLKYISLLEFLDQMRTYTSAKAGLIDMGTNYFNAIQGLNYQVGTQLVK